MSDNQGSECQSANGSKSSEYTWPKMKPMPTWKYIIACITLGLLCGWYYFIFLLYPTLIYLIYSRSSVIAGSILVLFLTLTYWPLKFKHWEAFMYSYIWEIWRDYFEFSYDSETVDAIFRNSQSKTDDDNSDNSKDHVFTKDQNYIFFEFPHGVFPMGQFISASVIRDMTPGKMICGSGANVIFSFPVMRQIMAWIGTRPADRKSMSKVFEEGSYCAVLPGGIAEMYIISEDQESIYLRKRRGTVRLAIENGAHIVPAFFFGNTRLFSILGKNKKDTKPGLLSKISRKLRASILFFYGTFGLPIPYRHPLRMVTGKIIRVTRKENPSDEEIDAVLNEVIQSLEEVFEKKKPVWEKRKLVIL
jgi:hypothetical protein